MSTYTDGGTVTTNLGTYRWLWMATHRAATLRRFAAPDEVVFVRSTAAFNRSLAMRMPTRPDPSVPETWRA